MCFCTSVGKLGYPWFPLVALDIPIVFCLSPLRLPNLSYKAMLPWKRNRIWIFQTCLANYVFYAHINSIERDRYGNKRRRSDGSANQPGRQSHVPGLSEEQSPIRPRFTYFGEEKKKGSGRGFEGRSGRCGYLTNVGVLTAQAFGESKLNMG
jgi:hypothetical protein